MPTITPGLQARLQKAVFEKAWPRRQAACSPCWADRVTFEQSTLLAPGSQLLPAEREAPEAPVKVLPVARMFACSVAPVKTSAEHHSGREPKPLAFSVQVIPLLAG